MGQCPVAEPPWMADLPRFPRPRFASLPLLASQTPEGHGGMPEQWWALTRRNRCAGCGCAVQENGWTVLLGENSPAASFTRLDGPLITHCAPGIFHLSCLITAVMSCPALKSSSRVYRHHRGFVGHPRGSAELVEFSHIGMPAFRDRSKDHFFAIWDLRKSIPFDNSKELAVHLENAITRERIDVRTRLYWRQEHTPQLLKLIEEDEKELADRWHFRRRSIDVGDHTYGIWVIK